MAYTALLCIMNGAANQMYCVIDCIICSSGSRSFARIEQLIPSGRKEWIRIIEMIPASSNTLLLVVYRQTESIWTESIILHVKHIQNVTLQLTDSKLSWNYRNVSWWPFTRPLPSLSFVSLLWFKFGVYCSCYTWWLKSCARFNGTNNIQKRIQFTDKKEPLESTECSNCLLRGKNV